MAQKKVGARHRLQWTETFGTERLTGALLDRLTHHVNILEMNGDSYRLGQSRARKAEAST
jgi:DNA replication protein DnaC